jgi:predicted NBD/HSP70 family sugar kinase
MILAVDVGGTKVLVASFSIEGVVQKTKKFKTPDDVP